MVSLIELLYRFDTYLTSRLEANSFTSNLLITPTSKFITEILVLTFIGLLSYEIIYWSGIYLNLWEYHAKDVFTEVPIHCAHVNIRLNIIDRTNEVRLKEYYDIKNKSRYHNLLYWKQLSDLNANLFRLNKFVKYYFEFSPDDFEMNKEPEFGSTISHLRNKILKLFNESELYRDYERDDVVPNDVKIFNNQYKEVSIGENENYLSKCNIETGNTIDAIVVL
ncbi:hypothetical protein FOB58_003784 [Candida parapsilosis]|uniref:Uncharacterized protein n=2 Tax=Candida parapsilosis TaxID=5480 RepID=G8B9B3_CANPC|nr:uncharacterized protein CPAR2_302020 [Candida parapsilosis]KAF6044146.1 hypothetical protein FOB60_005239 [Candida parapsilosis]KAF6047706.1 hypothetical protein FOB58_003784 [Candida parapsilosis]KAF6050326.1 hypothetical protein FOB59_002572 [Candida parapsilosis]KAF6061446.1 hypothetical protein FOB61_004203 [Candida parapsilosis]KAI5905929.1 Ergosterol biosynthesis protein 29 [Candida parapsilosis]